MAFTSYPWTNVHELNLDWLIRRIKEMSEHVEELEAAEAEFKLTAEELRAQMALLNSRMDDISLLYETFVDEVTARFEALRKSLKDDFDLLEQQVNSEIKDFEDQADLRMDGFEADLFALDARLTHVLNNLPSEIQMISPYTGELSTLDVIIYQLANGGRSDSLTASEYDAFAKTATEYDAYGMTAYQYDWTAATIIS